MFTINKIVRINANGRILELFELHPQAPEESREIMLLAYTFKDRRLLDTACTIKFFPKNIPGYTPMRKEALPEFSNGLALAGDGEVACLKREFWLNGRPMRVFNELVSYGLASNRYMAFQALEMNLVNDCMAHNGSAFSAQDIVRPLSGSDFHLLDTGVEALIGADWADTQGMANSGEHVAGVMAQFGISHPKSQLEET